MITGHVKFIRLIWPPIETLSLGDEGPGDDTSVTFAAHMKTSIALMVEGMTGACMCVRVCVRLAGACRSSRAWRAHACVCAGARVCTRKTRPPKPGLHFHSNLL